MEIDGVAVRWAGMVACFHFMTPLFASQLMRYSPSLSCGYKDMGDSPILNFPLPLYPKSCQNA